MRKAGNNIILSASDLSNHIACAHLTSLDLQVAHGTTAAPQYIDPLLEIMQERGFTFEEQYLNSLRAQGLTISEPNADKPDTSNERTITAMKSGVDIIYQADLSNGIWRGKADFLKKTNRSSLLGNWSYEVVDSKLAKETRAGTMLQLCLYAEQVSIIQGINPEWMYVITPGEKFNCQEYRVDDFMAYYRLVKKRLLEAVGTGVRHATYPEPVPQCDICRWWQQCDTRRRMEDHLSLVAGLSASHTVEIKKWNIQRLDQFGSLQLPFKLTPTRGAKETFERLQHQARVQLESRQKQKPIHEILTLVETAGLSRLPAPNDGDIFFDFEGDPFAGTKGLEYLFGWTFTENETDIYQRIWCLTPEDEKRAFEEFVDWVIKRWSVNPEMHIYHFSPYETVALKRLMGKYASRENEIDQLLRGGVFIDLHSVTKQSLRAGVESYSLKELEKFHSYARKLDLREASLQLRSLEVFLESNLTDNIPSTIIESVELYNKEDCLSTKSLRNWLETLRQDQIDHGYSIARPEKPNPDPNDTITKNQQRIAPIIAALTAGLPADVNERTNLQQGKWLLANMLDWYRREKKAAWWEFYRILDLTIEELLEEKTAIAGLEFTGQRVDVKKSVVDRYRFPFQEHEIKNGDGLKTTSGASFGEVISVDKNSHYIEIKKGPTIKEIHPEFIFVHKVITDEVKEEAVIRIAEWVMENDIDAAGDFRSGRDLLLRNPPRSVSLYNGHHNPQDAAVDWVSILDNGVLPIQGPPGAGKSHTAARMILELVKRGKKVGIVALSHKVIRGLLEKVVTAAGEIHQPLQCIQKVSNVSANLIASITETSNNDEVLSQLVSGSAQVAAGTAWLWARPEFAGAVDVLFVDEAGQLSLIDTLAVSQAASNLVLLGDPQQLTQPQQGSHPDGTEVSALEHILQEDKTLPPEKGIFLDETWRMHPDICFYISELFYENRLQSRPNLSGQCLDGHAKYSGAGLWYERVVHEGNQSSSPEEITRIAEIIAGLVNGKVLWTNQKKVTRTLQLSDIMVIAPYNSQVSALQAALHNGTHVGTVDKFQGQEAPVVIYSMTTSSPADAPRGMEFLYSLNRLNVAVSRARTVCILVASPKLFEPDCKSPDQMRLANAFCRYLEMAR